MATPQPIQPIQPVATTTVSPNPSLSHQAMGTTMPPASAGTPRLTMNRPTVAKLKQTATMAGKSPALGHKVALGSVILKRVWDDPQCYVPLAEEEKTAQVLFPLLLGAGAQSNAALKEFASGLYREMVENARSMGRGVRSAGETALSIPAAMQGHVAGKQQALNSLISNTGEVPGIYRISEKAQETYRNALRNAFLNNSNQAPFSLKAGRFAQRNVLPLSVAGGAAGVGLGAKILSRNREPVQDYPAMEQNPYTDPNLLAALSETKTASAGEDKSSFLRTLGLAAAGTGGVGMATGAIRPTFKVPLAVSGAILAAPIPGTTELLGAFGAGKAVGASGTLAARAYLNALRAKGHEEALRAAKAAGSVPIREAWRSGKSQALSGVDAVLHPLRTIDNITSGVTRGARRLLTSAPARGLLSALRIKAASSETERELLLLSKAFGDRT